MGARGHLGVLVFALLSAACPGAVVTSGDGAPDRVSPTDVARHEGTALLDRVSLADTGAREARLDVTVVPPLTNVTLLVNLGDSLGAGYYATAGHSYRALLVNNDNLLYPAYAGRDLTSRFPGIKTVDKAKSGATTSGVLQQALSVGGNAVGNTLVVVSAGGNDFNDNLLTMVDPLKAQAMAQQATANIKKMIDHFRDKALFPGQLTFVMLDVFDPTDGTGNVPPLPNLTDFCVTIQKLGFLVGPIAVQNLAAFDQTYATFAAQQGVLLGGIHAAFLGHGYHHNDPASPHYVPTDPTLWFHTDCAHGNDRGHHEIRRVIWKVLTGES